MNFGGIAPAFTAYKKAAFVVVPVPYDLTSTYQSGSRRGPGAILEASGNMELYDEELRKETYRSGIHTLPPLEADARGPAEMVDSVRRTISRIAADGKIPVMLGGEHSISFGAVQAMKEVYPEITVLQLDAHADLRDAYQGTPYSHASVARRISGICPSDPGGHPEHECRRGGIHGGGPCPEPCGGFHPGRRGLVGDDLRRSARGISISRWIWTSSIRP